MNELSLRGDIRWVSLDCFDWGDALVLDRADGESKIDCFGRMNLLLPSLSDPYELSFFNKWLIGSFLTNPM